MNKRDIKSIILYLDSAEAIEYLTNEQTGILFKAVFRYARTGQKLESSDTALTALFTILCAQIDRDHKKYIPQYVASTPEVRYRKNFENFLSERYWETHPLNTIQNETCRINCPGINENERRNGTYIKTQSKQLPVSTSQQRQAVITQQVLCFLQKYPTIESFFKVFNPQRQIFICQYPKYCIFGPSPTLAQIDTMYGPLTSAKWLVPLIADASLSCGLKEDVSENQLQFTAMAISNRYRWLKAGELMLFFFNFKAGFYERFYSHFDTQTIIRSFKNFLEERALTIAAHERNL